MLEKIDGSIYLFFTILAVSIVNSSAEPIRFIFLAKSLLVSEAEVSGKNWLSVYSESYLTGPRSSSSLSISLIQSTLLSLNTDDCGILFWNPSQNIRAPTSDWIREVIAPSLSEESLPNLGTISEHDEIGELGGPPKG